MRSTAAQHRGNKSVSSSHPLLSPPSRRRASAHCGSSFCYRSSLLEAWKIREFDITSDRSDQLFCLPSFLPPAHHQDALNDTTVCLAIAVTLSLPDSGKE